MSVHHVGIAFVYPRNASKFLTPPGLARFQEAYDHKRKAIGWWDRNTEAVGLIQCYLHVLGYKMTKSVKIDAKKALVPDGAFGEETFNAVWKFQMDNHIKADGMVGQDTFDALARKLDPPRPAAHGSYDAVIIHEVRRPCRPGEMICPDPDAN